MSVTYTADVFCDGELRGHWTHGATQQDKPPTKAQARNYMGDGFVRIGGNDYCPACVKKLAAEPVARAR